MGLRASGPLAFNLPQHVAVRLFEGLPGFISFGQSDKPTAADSKESTDVRHGRQGELTNGRRRPASRKIENRFRRLGPWNQGYLLSGP